MRDECGTAAGNPLAYNLADDSTDGKGGKHESLDASPRGRRPHTGCGAVAWARGARTEQGCKLRAPARPPRRGHGNSRGARPLPAAVGPGDGVLRPRRRARQGRPGGPARTVRDRQPAAPGGVHLARRTHAAVSPGRAVATAGALHVDGGREHGPLRHTHGAAHRHHPVEQRREARGRRFDLADVRRAPRRAVPRAHGHCRAPLPPGDRSRGEPVAEERRLHAQGHRAQEQLRRRHVRAQPEKPDPAGDAGDRPPPSLARGRPDTVVHRGHVLHGRAVPRGLLWVRRRPGAGHAGGEPVRPRAGAALRPQQPQARRALLLGAERARPGRGAQPRPPHAGG